MRCQNQNCHDDARCLLTQNMDKPVWMCPYCAAKTLKSTNPDSFKTIKEKSIISYKKTDE